MAKDIADIYQTDLKIEMNKANPSNKEIPFLDLDINVISNNIYTSVYDKCDDFGFSIHVHAFNSPVRGLMFLYSHLTVLSFAVGSICHMLY